VEAGRITLARAPQKTAGRGWVRRRSRGGLCARVPGWHRSHPKPNIHLRLLASFVVCFTSSALASASCIGPQALQTSPQVHPTANRFADLGKWFGDHRRYDCATDALQKAIALDPASARLHYLLGLSLYSSGRLKEAVPPLQESIQRDASALDPHLTLGAVLSRLENRAEAEIQWRAALALDPKSPMALAGLSRDLLAEADYEAVIASLHPVAVAGQLTPDLAINLSGAYSKAGCSTMLPTFCIIP
jgi:Flp pilus assembly protein TadD